MLASTTTDVLFPAHFRTVMTALEQAMERENLRELVIEAGGQHMIFQDDQPYPYRVNPWFAWLAPASAAPGSLIHIGYNGPPKLIFVAPDDYWHSPPSIPDDSWTACFDLVPVASAAAARAALPAGDAARAWLGESPPAAQIGPVNPARLIAHLEQARCRKTAYEVACLREATRIGVLGHLAAERAFRNGASEFDIHLQFLAATRQNEIELPYGSIVALNEHCATLHYQLRDLDPPRRRHSLLIDAGASCRGYASDITRTWATGPGIFATLVDGMHRLQQDLCEAVKPGLDWRELHLRTHLLVAQLLKTTGVLRMSAEEAVSTGASSAFLPHGLGHLLGLQVHDIGAFRPTADSEPLPRPPGHPSLRLTRPLVAGMVVTVEPGLYFIDSLLEKLRASPQGSAVNWTLVDTLRPCGGIRIEDNVVVTQSGHENLTRDGFAAVA